MTNRLRSGITPTPRNRWGWAFASEDMGQEPSTSRPRNLRRIASFGSLLAAIGLVTSCSDPSGGAGPEVDAAADPQEADTVAEDVETEVADSADTAADSPLDAVDPEPDAGDDCVAWAGGIFAYEASRSDATGSSHGQSGVVCSREGVLPWVEVSWE